MYLWIYRWYTYTLDTDYTSGRKSKFAVTEGNKSTATAKMADRGVARAKNK